MNQPPIDNQFVQLGCEQFTQPSDTPKTDLACSGPAEKDAIEAKGHWYCKTFQPASDTPNLMSLELKGEDIWLHVNPKGSVKASFNLGHGPPDDIFHRALNSALNQQEDTPNVEHLLDEIVDTKTELARLSAELEKDKAAFVAAIDLLNDEVEHERTQKNLRHKAYLEQTATLAERDRQLAEATAEIETLKDWYRNTKNASDLFSADNVELKAQLADSQRQLAMAIDAANKGDEARCKAGAMQDMIDDLQRQKAELEGSEEKWILWATDARADVLRLEEVIKKKDAYIKRHHCDCRHDKYSGKLLAKCQRCAALEVSIRQSTQTEEEK